MATTTSSDNDDYEKLARRLSQDLAPVRVVRAGPLVGAGWALVAGAVCVTVAAAGLRSDLSLRLQEPLYVAGLALWSLAVLGGVATAVWSAVPGGVARRRGVAVATVAATILGIVLCNASVDADSGATVADVGAHALLSAVFGIAPFALLFGVVTRLAPQNLLVTATALTATAVAAGTLAALLHAPAVGVVLAVGGIAIPWMIGIAAVLPVRHALELAREAASVR